MAATPDQIMALAVKLRDGATNEAELRSAVSRSYYAALLTADQVLPQRDPGLVNGGDSSHIKIIARAQAHSGGAVPKPGRTEAAVLAKLLPKMKRDRVTADYYLDVEITPNACSDALKRAANVIENCTKLNQKLQQAA